MAPLVFEGRNNFHLIRLVAAIVVIVSHSFVLSGSSGEPLHPLGMSMGEVAVDVFFITSGFLVTKSLLVRNSITEFISARVLRIYPGLIVMIALTILVAGLFSAPGFYSDPVTRDYFLSNALIGFDKLADFYLPGVFGSNPDPGVVNGSLHTLPYELRMYGILACLWMLLLLRKQSRLKWMAVAVMGLAVAGFAGRMILPQGQLTRYIFMFFTGGAFYILRAYIRLDARIAWAALAAVCVSAVWHPLFFIAYNLVLAYMLFCAAYLPKLWVPKHDYSYGVYIYAFPIQQVVWMLSPGVSWWMMALSTIPVVLLLAAASWHLVEKPALGLKNRLHSYRVGGVGIPMKQTP